MNIKSLLISFFLDPLPDAFFHFSPLGALVLHNCIALHVLLQVRAAQQIPTVNFEALILLKKMKIYLSEHYYYFFYASGVKMVSKDFHSPH